VAEAICFPVIYLFDCTSICPYIILCVAWYFLYLVDRFQWNLPQMFILWVGIAEKVFKVRDQSSRSYMYKGRLYKYANAIVGVMLRLTCLFIAISHAEPHHILSMLIWAVVRLQLCVVVTDVDFNIWRRCQRQNISWTLGPKHAGSGRKRFDSALYILLEMTKGIPLTWSIISKQQAQTIHNNWC